MSRKETRSSNSNHDSGAPAHRSAALRSSFDLGPHIRLIIVCLTSALMLLVGCETEDHDFGFRAAYTVTAVYQSWAASSSAASGSRVATSSSSSSGSRLS